MAKVTYTRIILTALAVGIAPIVGPRLGEWVTGFTDGGPAWQLLPWGLLALTAVALAIWVRRSPRQS